MTQQFFLPKHIAVFLILTYVAMGFVLPKTPQAQAFETLNFDVTDPSLGELEEPGVGIGFELIGPFYGKYKLGLNSLVTSKIDLGISGTYYNTYLFWPRMIGWETDLRVNYALGDFRKGGWFIGASVGYISVKNKDDRDANWTLQEGLTWSVIPGYAYRFSPHATLFAGVEIGRNAGEFALGPEVGSVITF